MESQHYTRLAVFLHWTIAILLIPMLFFGENLIDARGVLWPSVHASVGITILALSVVRLALRLANSPPPPPLSMPEWQRRASAISHVLFYVLMIGLPPTGMFAAAAMTRPPVAADIQIFGLFSMADLGLPAIPATRDIHEIGGKIGIALLILHAAAALYHQFWLKDGLLRRMT